MNGLNRVMLIGNLGRDPEIRHTPSGTPVANFTLATNESFNDRSGNRQDRTEWHRVVAWGKLAEICGQYLNKGKQVFIEGRLQTRSWEDQQGQKRQTTEVVANNMIMLSRGDGAGAGSYQTAGAGGAQSGGASSGGTQAADPMGGYVPDSSLDPASDDDDLPF